MNELTGNIEFNSKMSDLDLTEKCIFASLQQYESAFDLHFGEFIEKYNLDEETFFEIKQKHLNMVKGLLEEQVRKVLHRSDVQAKLVTIHEIDSKLTTNPDLLTQILPLKSQHYSQMEKINTKITESRNSALDQLEANSESIRGRPVKNKTKELLEKIYDLTLSL